MKIKSGLTLLGATVFLATAPAALAGKGAAEAPEMDPAVCEMAPEEGETVVEAESGGDTEVVLDQEAGEEVLPEECAHEEGEPCVLGDWVKRGGDENPEIYYNMAEGGAEVLKGGAEAAPDLGQDEKAAAIDTKVEKFTPLVTGQKKGPVALMKKGRVFLR